MSLRSGRCMALPFRLALAVTLSFGGTLPASAMTNRIADASVTHAADSTPPQHPSAKQLISTLIRNSGIPLSVSATCVNAGTSRDDTTIGDYISGFLAELGDADAKNTITASVSDDPQNGESSTWIARVMIAQSHGEVVWRWGVEFAVRKHDLTADPDSFRCIGAG